LTTRLALALAATLGLALPAYSVSAAAATSQSAEQANPFFAESPLPLHYPQFDKIKDSDFAPAFDAGMAAQLKEVDAIANNKAAPTFENTLIALENSGAILDRATTVFFSLIGADTNDTRKVRRAQRCHQPQWQAVLAYRDPLQQPRQAGPGCRRRASGREIP
jgi:peptidyl-dipeptidase Dcp